jgi:putative MATE family efflux protein
MKENSKDFQEHTSDRMGAEPIGKLLLKMSGPAILMMTVHALYNIVDSIFVSYLGEKALTAVSLVMPFQQLIISVMVGTGVGLSSFISRRLGAKMQEEADTAASMSLRIAIFNYLLFLTIGLILTRPVMGYYTDDPVIYNYSCSYMRIILGFSIFSSVEILLEKVMQATGNMTAPMVCSLAGSIVNVILDPIFIFGLFGMPKMEVKGAAIATVIAQAVTLVVASLILKTRKQSVNIRMFEAKTDFTIIKNIYAVGLPSIILMAIGFLLMLGYNAILTSVQTAIAVLGVYFKLESFVFMPVFGINQGLLPLIGYNYGAGDRDRFMAVYKYALTLAIIIMVMGTLLFNFFPDKMLKLFNADEGMLEIGIPALRIISLCFIPAAFGVITSTVFQGTGHGFYSLIGSAIRQLVGVLPIAYILFHAVGLEASWFSFPLGEILGVVYSAAMLARLYRKEIKKLKRI